MRIGHTPTWLVSLAALVAGLALSAACFAAIGSPWAAGGLAVGVLVTVFAASMLTWVGRE